MLRGKKIWLDPDLTRAQAEDKKKELVKVREATNDGWIAYLRDGRAVVTDLWTSADVIILTETWEYRETSGITIPEFSRVAAVWNKKRFCRGRGFGGIAIYIRQNLGLDFEVECLDPEKHFIGLRFGSDNTLAFLFAAYYPPWDSPSYSADMREGDGPMLHLAKEILKIKDLGPVWVCGDFNSRSRTAQGIPVEEVGEVPWHQEMTVPWARISEDTGVNRLTEHFLRLELMRDPELFWKRMRPERRKSELGLGELRDYVRKLYFFPGMESMPISNGAACEFTEAEVARELARLGSGKALDLKGLSIEMLRWGGPKCLQGKLITNCSYYKYLGVEITAKMKWQECMEDCCWSPCTVCHVGSL
ncbi:hypothetical protein R1sor_027181 [Riccia sorocarpa]|uniref:Endonuclease/exonuclease/phosphatase domain-containing protein n=1 Tax=Riccia sorocarpa TaxID=122646 RepID=A0ABD3GDG9_9MARC